MTTSEARATEDDSSSPSRGKGQSASRLAAHHTLSRRLNAVGLLCRRRDVARKGQSAELMEAMSDCFRRDVRAGRCRYFASCEAARWTALVIPFQVVVFTRLAERGLRMTRASTTVCYSLYYSVCYALQMIQ